MISAFGITHVVSKADEPPKESNRARRRRVAEEKAQGITRPGGAPEAKPKTEPKPEVKVEAPKPEPKVEAPKPGGTMGASGQEAAQPKPQRTVGRAYGIGQARAFREGKGPIASAVNGLKFVSAAHPGKTAAVVGGTSAGLAGAAYLGGRAQQKKRDGQ